MMFYYRNSFWHITVPLCQSVQTLNMFLLRITEPGSEWNLIFPLLKPESEREAAHWFFKASEGWNVGEIIMSFRSDFVTKDVDINEFILDIVISGWWERLCSCRRNQRPADILSCCFCWICLMLNKKIRFSSDDPVSSSPCFWRKLSWWDIFRLNIFILFCFIQSKISHINTHQSDVTVDEEQFELFLTSRGQHLINSPSEQPRAHTWPESNWVHLLKYTCTLWIFPCLNTLFLTASHFSCQLQDIYSCLTSTEL